MSLVDAVSQPDTALPDLVRSMLTALGEDPTRDGLLRTPERVAKSMQWLTRGYSQSVADAVGDGVFEGTHESMVVVRDIEVYSLCEHHMLPFFGKCHVAYIPTKKVIGLSKVPRLVDVFARRLQLQERLTNQIAQALMEKVKPLGVGVIIEAQHLCMVMRGVQKQNSVAVTSAMLGVFRKDHQTREEFLSLVRKAS